jgi:hypothetical protein
MQRCVPSSTNACGGVKTNTRKRWAVLVAAVAVMAGLLACTTSTFISRREESPPAPAKTLRPTFTTTAAPGMALVPTNTPVPEGAPVPDGAPVEPGETVNAATTPVPGTIAPVVGAASPGPPTSADTPSPTNIAAPTSTGVPGSATPEPTTGPEGGSSPTPTLETQPSATLGPLSSWTGQVSDRGQDCGLTRLLGLTRYRNGDLAGDIWIHYWSDGGISKWASSHAATFGAGPSLGESEANWDGNIGPYPVDGLWHVCVVDAPQSPNCLSNRVDVETSSDCRSGDQIVHITFLEN